MYGRGKHHEEGPDKWGLPAVRKSMYTHAVDIKGASGNWGVGITELGRCSAPAGGIALLAAMAGSEIVGATEEGDSSELCRALSCPIV